MTTKEGAYGGLSTTTGKERKTWDKDEYAAQAKAKDAEYAERARERAEALKSGKKPRRRAEELPKPTKTLQARDELNLDKNQGKTIIIASGRPGFTCTMCRRTFKDSASYLGHVNGRMHLRKLGQTTKVARSTLEEVQAKIEELREQSRKDMEAKAYDFELRLKEIKAAEQTEKESRREKKRLVKEAADEAKRKLEEQGADPDMMAMMGFSSFD